MRRKLTGSKMTAALAVVCALALPGISSAVPISYDEIIYQTTTTPNPALLRGTIDMTFAGSVLTITLTNTSADAASNDSAGNLLTGIGFNLPPGMSIRSGSLSMSGETAVGFTAPGDGNVSQEWGYDNGPLKSGGFLGIAVHTVNTAVSSMESQTDTRFAMGSLFNPPQLNGPDGGLLSANFTGTLGNGEEAIRDSVVIRLTLNGTYADNLLTFIDTNPVVLSFGSPDPAPQQVPEPRTLLLVGAGVLAMGMIRRRRA